MGTLDLHHTGLCDYQSVICLNLFHCSVIKLTTSPNILCITNTKVFNEPEHTPNFTLNYQKGSDAFQDFLFVFPISKINPRPCQWHPWQRETTLPLEFSLIHWDSASLSDQWQRKSCGFGIFFFPIISISRHQENNALIFLRAWWSHQLLNFISPSPHEFYTTTLLKLIPALFPSFPVYFFKKFFGEFPGIFVHPMIPPAFKLHFPQP